MLETKWPFGHQHSTGIPLRSFYISVGHQHRNSVTNNTMSLTSRCHQHHIWKLSTWMKSFGIKPRLQDGFFCCWSFGIFEAQNIFTVELSKQHFVSLIGYPIFFFYVSWLFPVAHLIEYWGIPTYAFAHTKLKKKIFNPKILELSASFWYPTTRFEGNSSG